MTLLLLLATLPLDAVTRERCDLVEVNNFYDDDAKPVFIQAVFLDWRPAQSLYDVRAWRLLKSRDQRPRRDHVRGGYVMTWLDGDRLREVRSDLFRESFSQYDVEQVERERLPKELRRGLLYERTAP